MLLYSVHRTTFQNVLPSYQYLKRTRNNFVTDNHNALYKGLGQVLPQTKVVVLPNMLTIWKRAVCLEKVRNVAQLKPSSLLELELGPTWPAVTTPTLLELCGAWPAVTPPTLLWRLVHPPTNRKAPHVCTARGHRTACESVSAHAPGV